ncbi:MAG: hypothetical protein E7655_08340 [Ruminococcaceae bacterium]|nr:hypothetical protein [Oscillospiraceae bacterium]
MKKNLLIVVLCVLLAALSVLTVFSANAAARYDVDGDGSVTVLDALAILRYITDGEGQPSDPSAVETTIVLTATDTVSILNGDSPAQPGSVRFRVLNEFGQLGNVSYTCKASALGIADSAEAYLFHSYHVRTNDDFATFAEVKKVEAVSAESVTAKGDGKITVDGVTYTLVEQLDPDSDTPALIVRGENKNYALLYSIDANAYPELTLFDDNGDGTPDRGLYKDYQFGLYTSSFAIADADGKTVRTVLIDPTVIGKDIKIGDFIVYSYNETADLLYVKEVAEKISGVVSGLNAGSGTIRVGGVYYPYGLDTLPGAWTYPNSISTQLLGKIIDLYTVGGRGVYFEMSTSNSAPVIVYISKGTPYEYKYNSTTNQYHPYTEQAINVVNGGILPYGIYLSQSNVGFYVSQNGSVASPVTPLDIAAAESEIKEVASAGGTLSLSNTRAYQAATKDKNNHVYLYKFSPGYGLRYQDINTTIKTCTVRFPSASYTGTDNAFVSYSNTVLLPYAMVNNKIKTTDDSDAEPRVFNHLLTATMHQKTQYMVNYSGIAADSSNAVCITVYQSDFDRLSSPSHFVRHYANVNNNPDNPRISAISRKDFVEYVVFRTAGGPVSTHSWDRLRLAAGGAETGDVDVTKAMKLHCADGTVVDPAACGLTFTVKDSLFFGEDEKQSFLEIRRDPMKNEPLPSLDNYYITFEYEGLTYLVDRISISLAGSAVWYADSPYTVLDKVTATADGNQFTLFVDLADLQLTIAQVENALKTMTNTLYRYQLVSATYLHQEWDRAADLISFAKITDTEYAFTFEAHETFTPGEYAFELSFPGNYLNFIHAIKFTVS